MADTLTLARNPKTGPTHYETLGVSPTATSGEVTRAFASKMSSLTPRPVAALAQISVAYETLRDPEKRRAYDASLSPAPKSGYSFRWTAAPSPSPAHALVDRLTRSVDDHPPEATLPSDVSGVNSTPTLVSAPPPPVEQHPPTVRRPAPAREILAMEDYAPARRPRVRYDDSAIDWKKLAAAAGWPILGVAIIGGVAGWSANIVEQPQPTEPLKVALPRLEQTLETADAAMPSPPTAIVDARPAQSPRRAAVAAASVDSKKPKLEQTEASSAELPQVEEAAITPPVDQLPPTEVATSNMPLSNSTIARTIGRIGYACGKVASTTPVDGASGVFKVTCSSGDSYQASPVRGRYHFRRWAGR